MSVLQQKKRLTPEERKAMREKYSIHDKEGETIYRHYRDLDGADFKLFKNKNCEIYILDWSKGMFVDECENCTIVIGPIDGSIFIRKCKNCKVSIIARQVRFRESENIEIYTYCPSDPAVESSFNIFFAPYNAFFPHLSELFEKGGFNSAEKNHIDTPYDFTPSEVLGGGAKHFLQLPEEKFNIKIINDGDAPLDELFKGYSEKEPFLINKASELPKLGEINNKNANINLDDFGFGDNNENIANSNNMNTEVFNNIQTNPKRDINEMIKINNINNNIMSMDDFISSNNFNNNTMTNQNTTINFDNFNFGTSNNNNNNINNNIAFNNFDTQLQKNTFQSYNISKQNMTKEMEEEIKLEEIRQKAKELREERIRALMEKEAKLKNEIMRKASEYMNQFYQERKKKIEMNHQKLLEQENNQNRGNNNGNVWENISSNMTDSSSGADRMKETIINKSKQDQNN